MVIERWEFSRAAIICRAGRHMRAFRIYISALKMGLPRLYCKNCQITDHPVELLRQDFGAEAYVNLKWNSNIAFLETERMA